MKSVVVFFLVVPKKYFFSPYNKTPCIFQFIRGNPGRVETSGKHAIGFWG